MFIIYPKLCEDAELLSELLVIHSITNRSIYSADHLNHNQINKTYVVRSKSFQPDSI
jgi:hypothetical protein